MCDKPSIFNDTNDPDHRFTVYDEAGSPVLLLGYEREGITIKYHKQNKEILIVGKYDDGCSLVSGVITFADFLKALGIK